MNNTVSNFNAFEDFEGLFDYFYNEFNFEIMKENYNKLESDFKKEFGTQLDIDTYLGERYGNKNVVKYHGYEINLEADYEYIEDEEIEISEIRERLDYYSDSWLLYEKCFEIYENCNELYEARN